MSGVGVLVNSAAVHTCSECNDDPAFKQLMKDEAGNFKEGRVFVLRVGEKAGGKLTERSVDAVIFTLNMLLGNGTKKQTLVPNLRTYAVAFED
jgi:hypothetical protein